MKNVKKLGLFAFALSFIFTSCQKFDETMPVNESETQEATVTEATEGEIILTKAYDGKLSLEEVTALWTNEVKKLGNGTPLKSYATSWNHDVLIHTDDYSYDGTDGAVQIQIRYQTPYGTHTKSWKSLNKNGELTTPDTWRFYLITSDLDGREVQWVKVLSCQLKLEGTDGLGFDYLHVRDKYTNNTHWPCSGESYVTIQKRRRMLASSSTSWDYYNTLDDSDVYVNNQKLIFDDYDVILE